MKGKTGYIPYSFKIFKFYTISLTFTTVFCRNVPEQDVLDPNMGKLKFFFHYYLRKFLKVILKISDYSVDLYSRLIYVS